jgi:hypothetical protein
VAGLRPDAHRIGLGILQKGREPPWENPITLHKNDTQALVQCLAKNGQALWPMVDLIEQSRLA